ncbi:MAG: lipocalin-like domain-containing protein [Verrucomicrobia bacterium]|nr:lipocalin-like domain-containing protein [Verrucomicrobiota bacterium]
MNHPIYREETMKTHVLLGLVGLATGFVTPAFTQTTAKDLVGAWTLVSVTLEQNGKKTELYGPNPGGLMIRDADGHVAVIITKSGLPAFAGNDRMAGTPEENKAIVQGCLAYFGTSTVNEADQTITTHIERSTFPNWNGTDRKVTFSISGDELDTVSTATPSTGTGTAHLVWRRAK